MHRKAPNSRYFLLLENHFAKVLEAMRVVGFVEDRRRRRWRMVCGLHDVGIMRWQNEERKEQKLKGAAF
jgi:hypothetical protein